MIENFPKYTNNVAIKNKMFANILYLAITKKLEILKTTIPALL